MRKWFQNLDYQMYMVWHDHLRQYFQFIAFPFIELRKSTEHLTHTSTKRVELNKCRSSTLSLKCSKQRITPFYR